MFLDTLIQVPACKTNITRIAQVAFKFVDNTLSVHNRWLSFTQFKILLDLVADKYRLYNPSNLLAQIVNYEAQSQCTIGFHWFFVKKSLINFFLKNFPYFLDIFTPFSSFLTGDGHQKRTIIELGLYALNSFCTNMAITNFTDHGNPKTLEEQICSAKLTKEIHNRLIYFSVIHTGCPRVKPTKPVSHRSYSSL